MSKRTVVAGRRYRCEVMMHIAPFLIFSVLIPTWVGWGGEESDTNDFGVQNPGGMLVSIELRGSVLRSIRSNWDSLFIPEFFPWPAAPPCRARLVLVPVGVCFVQLFYAYR